MADTWKSGNEVDFSGSDTVTKWYRFDVNGNSNQKVVVHTFKSGNKVLRNYTMLYDKTKKAALWSAFAMNKGSYPHNYSRADNWNYDPALDKSWQPNLSSSYGGGYERGHQVASNDRRTTIYQMYQTDYYSNMTPQLSAFNAGDQTEWDELEGKIQTLGYATSGSDTLYVVTGALFDDGFKTDATDANNKACPVPTRYYKCVLLVHFENNKAQSAQGGAYLVEHKANATIQTMKIDDLETETGFDFFTNIESSVQTSAENKFVNLL